MLAIFATGLAFDLTVLLLLAALGIGIALELSRERRTARHVAKATQVAAWCEDAKELGEDDAQSAATWVTDGNRGTATWYEELLAKLRGCEAEPWELPSKPNLAHEFGDELCIPDLVRNVTGEDYWDADPEVIELICDAYEEGVDEAWEPALERELMKALGKETADA
jgi:hypothetical protein